jgi:hypothetical protein
MKKVTQDLKVGFFLSAAALLFTACSVQPAHIGATGAAGSSPATSQAQAATPSSTISRGSVRQATGDAKTAAAKVAVTSADKVAKARVDASHAGAAIPASIALTNDAAPRDQITVDGKLKAAPTVLASQDENGGTVLELSAEIAHAEFTPGLNDGLRLALAASRSFVSPGLNGCVLTDDSLLVLGRGSQTVSIGARDASGTTTCAEFMSAIQKHGFTVQYVDVPLLSGNGNVKTVFVNLTAP